MPARFLLCSTVLLAALACSEAAAPMTASTPIGPTGGVVALPTPEGGSAGVDVPAGAVTTKEGMVLVTVTTSSRAPDSLPSGTEAAGQITVFGPEGHVFASPITIHVPATSRASLLVTRPVGDTTWTEVEGARYVPDQMGMTAKVTHFSEFLALAVVDAAMAKQNDAPDAGPGAGESQPRLDAGGSGGKDAGSAVDRGADSGPAACPSCPAGFSCVNGVCAGGNLSKVELATATYAVSGTVTVNGAAPTRDAAFCADPTNAGQVLAQVSISYATNSFPFDNPRNGAEVALTCATTNANGFSFSVTLPPGTYTARVDPGRAPRAAGVNLVPRWVQAGLVVSGPGTKWMLNEALHTVAGKVTIAGAPPTRNATYCAGAPSRLLATVRFQVVDPTGTQAYTTAGVAQSLTCDTTMSQGFTFSVRLPPGTYKVAVESGGPGGTNLVAGSYPTHNGLVVSGPISNLVLNEGVMYPVSGILQVDGAAPTRDAAYCSGPSPREGLVYVSFHELGRNFNATSLVTCATPNAQGFAFAVTLMPGTYDVYVESPFPETTGVNVATGYVKRGLVVGGPLTNLVLNQPGRVTVAGRITVNGAAPTRSAAYCDTSGSGSAVLALLSLVGTGDNGSTTSLTCASTNKGDFTFSTKVPLGTYKARVMPGGWANAAGVNLVAYDSWPAFVVSGPVDNLVFNETIYPVSGVVTINGAAPKRDATFCNDAVHANYPPLGIVRFLNANRAISLNFPYDATYTLTCANTAAGFNYKVNLPPGTFEVRVGSPNSIASQGTNLLAAQAIVKTDLVVNGPIGNLTLNATGGHPISGTVTVNGATPTRSVVYCNDARNLGRVLALVTFLDAGQSYRTTFPMTCATTNSTGFGYSVVLPAGTYDVGVQRGEDATAAGVNISVVNTVVATGLRVP